MHHHLIGILQPEERFSVAAYVARAQACIAEIRARGSLPILAGGTGLYIDTLLDHIELIDAPASPETPRGALPPCGAGRRRGALGAAGAN